VGIQENRQAEEDIDNTIANYELPDMAVRIKISVGDKVFYAQLKNTPTATAISNALPIQSSANIWGDEIYFKVPVQAALEPEAKARVNVGDLAYWPSMPTFCIFFGATPVSHDGTPVAASAVNVFGRLEKVDLEQLRSVRDGEAVVIETA
jgi:hypothetical protein